MAVLGAIMALIVLSVPVVVGTLVIAVNSTGNVTKR